MMIEIDFVDVRSKRIERMKDKVDLSFQCSMQG